jgi:hypothetical protein
MFSLRITILEIISRISIVTNAALIVFTMNNLQAKHYSLTFRFWVFILFQWVAFAAQVSEFLSLFTSSASNSGSLSFVFSPSFDMY